ncbi:MAG: hypothetical protein ACHQIM_04665 [Sphingobacteriales bacterium]
MKKSLFLLTLLIGATFCVYAQNDDSAPKISAGFSVGVTTGTHAADLPVASGIHVKLEYPISDNQVSLMLTAGYTGYVSSNGYSTGYSSYGGSYTNGTLVSFVPVEAGVRFYVFNKLFVQGDAGASFSLNSASSGYTGQSVALIVSPSAGYSIPFGSSRFGLDLSLGYEDRIESAGGVNQTSGYVMGSYNQVVFRAAFKFGL